MNVLSKENKFLATFASSMLALSIITISSVASDDTKPVVAIEVLTAARTPAAVSLASKVKPEKIKFKSISLNLCEETSAVESPYEVRGQFVQIKGKNCIKDNDLSVVKIINQTNGYTASLLPSGSNEYQTDLIQLNEGNNQIVLQYQSFKGQPLERKITLKAQIQQPQL